MKKFFTMAIVALAAGMSACARAPSNVQTLVSDDCGQNWRLIPIGNVVPSGVTNTCYMRVTVPNYPMAGESNFRGTFANTVRVNANSSYDYTITDPLKFIRQARFVSKQGVDGDDPKNAASVWDTAESIIIDRLLREIANSREFLQAENIVDFNQGDFEDRLLTVLNEKLKERGVQLNTFTFVVTPDDQTRNMIDVAAALRVCESIQSLNPEACKSIITARAGATRISFSTVKDAETN